MALRYITPYTRQGAPGLCLIVDEANVQATVQKYAQELLDDGYVRVVVTERHPTRATRWTRRTGAEVDGNAVTTEENCR